MIELEHYGVPFRRTDEGKIYQRPSAAMTTNSAKARPSAPAPPPTVPATPLLHTLYQQALRHKAEFFIEYFALDLIMDEDGACRGVVAWNLDDGTMHRFRLARRVLATGGYGRAYFSAPRRIPAPATATAWWLRAGLPLQDMEFVQFHPTGIYRRGLPDHRGCARRRRLPDQFRGRAFHGALCTDAKDLASATWSAAR